MADSRGQADLGYGHLGRITYISPRDAANPQPGVLHTSRAASNTPHVKVLGSSAELYPPSKTPIPEASSNLWRERRTQKRWLLHAHPEAFMGNSALQGFLEEDMDRFQKAEGQAGDRPLLAMGQMTDVRDASRVSGAPMLAAATGESGELLRLARIDESRWAWDGCRDVTLSLSVIDPDDPEEEAIWASDGLPISQVKFATSLTRYDAVRWLLVQKQTSTTILQPEYHKVPVAQAERDRFGERQGLSRINPKPLATLSHKETGGNAQVDVAFNPGAKGQQPQLAIMDECGYWSVWDVVGTTAFGKNTTRLSMNGCGHIAEGFLDEMPATPAFSAEVHGIMFVGTAEADDFWGDPSQASDEAGGFATRSQHVCLWSRDKLEVVNLATRMALPRLSLLTPAKGWPDWIIDVQVNPVNQNHILVLTMRHLYWVDLFAAGREEEASKPLILMACPHLIDGQGLRMSTCRATDSRGQDVCMVVACSPEAKQMHTYWFGYSAENIPQWNRQVLALPSEGGTALAGMQSLEIHSCKLVALGKSARGPGSDYHRGGVRFYQGSVLGKDLSIRYFICASVLDPSEDVNLPTSRVERFKAGQTGQWKKKRRHFLRHIEQVFVYPDGVDDFAVNSLVRRKASRDGNTAPSRVQGPIRFKFDILVGAIAEANARHSARRDISAALITAVDQIIQEGVANGRLPLVTWKEIERHMGPHYERDDDAQVDMSDLLSKNEGDTVVTQLGRASSGGAWGGVDVLSGLTRSLSRLWLDPWEGRLSGPDEVARRDWVAGLAREAFLSTSGAMVQDVKLFGEGGGQDDAASSGQARQSSSMRIKSSQSSDGGIPSSPISTASADVRDAAVQRLQLLAPTLRLGDMATAKTSSVLAYWPVERGVGTEDYVSSVAVASESKFDEAKQRLKKIEDRRRAQVEKYKIPGRTRPNQSQSQSQAGWARSSEAGGGGGELPAHPAPAMRAPTIQAPTIQAPKMRTPTIQAAPAVQIMSSQGRGPDSSQSQGLSQFVPVAMSQPMPGAFGDRKKAKKAKRKSGFR